MILLDVVVCVHTRGLDSGAPCVQHFAPLSRRSLSITTISCHGLHMCITPSVDCVPRLFATARRGCVLLGSGIVGQKPRSTIFGPESSPRIICPIPQPPSPSAVGALGPSSFPPSVFSVHVAWPHRTLVASQLERPNSLTDLTSLIQRCSAAIASARPNVGLASCSSCQCSASPLGGGSAIQPLSRSAPVCCINNAMAPSSSAGSARVCRAGVHICSCAL